LPIQIGFFVYSYAKLRMLAFYFDVLVRYIPRPLFSLCEMDTGLSDYDILLKYDAENKEFA